jgi:hypothetical protein
MAVAASLLLLLPLASAAEAPPVATLSVSAVSATDGALEGPLVGAVWTAPKLTLGSMPRTSATDSVETLQVPLLDLQARFARISLYQKHSIAANRDPTDSHSPKVTEASDLRLDGMPAGDADSARLVVMPMASEPSLLHVDGPLRANRTDATTLPLTPRSTDVQFSVPLNDTAYVASAGDAGTLRITGSFRLVLDAIDLPYTSGSGSGHIAAREDLGPVWAYGGSTTASPDMVEREAVVDLWDATIVVTRVPAFFSHAALRSTALDFENSTGKAGSRAVALEPVHAEGDLLASVAVSADHVDSLAVRVVGQASDLRLGAHSVAASGHSPPPATLALALLAIPALPAAQWAVARRRFTRMDRALDRGDFQAALRLSERFTPWPSQRQDSILAAAICLLGLGRPAEACERLAGSRWSIGRRPMRDFLRARGNAALGRVEEAQRALAASLLAEPALIAQARTDPVLAALVDGPRDATATQEAYA